ncbi:MAG: formyltransferase family protein [Candidatus Hodarchaeota archaeon]
MNVTILTNAGSAIIHAIFYLKLEDIDVNNVIVKGEPKKYFLLEEYAATKKFKVDFVDDLNSGKTLKIINEINPDILVLMSSKIIKKEIISVPKHTINVHAGFLPRYRGFDVRRWAILEGGELGATAHYASMDADLGDIIIRRKLEILKGDTVSSISERNYYKNRFQVLSEAIQQIKTGTVIRKPQKPEDGKRFFWMHPKLRELVDKKLRLSS